MDSVKRLEYDLKWPNIRAARDAEQERKKREQEAARAKEGRRREEADRQKQENQKRKAEDEELKRNQDIRLQKALAGFRQEADQLQSQIFERNRIIRRLSIGIKELDNRDKQASQSPEYGSGWHTSAHSGYSKNEVERARDAEHHQRQASRRIKESHLLQEKDKLKVDEMRLTCAIHHIEIGKYLINGCRTASSDAREYFIAEAEWNLMMARSFLARQLRELEDEKEEGRKRKVELERAAAKREELRIEREEMAKRKRKRATDEQEDEAQKRPRIVKDSQHSSQSYRRNPSSRRIRRGFAHRFN
jgi:hypothetical protein